MDIEKAYFILPEILDRWSIFVADLIYRSKNDELRTIGSSSWPAA